MNGPVVAGIITSAVAIFVAVAGAIRNDLQRAAERRYERRRQFLIDLQEATLALRDALRDYGEALRRNAGEPARPGGVADQRRAVAVAGGRLELARSRVEDGAVLSAVSGWELLAREVLIAVRQNDVPNEDAAFAALNGVVSRALRSARGLGRR